MIEPKIVIIEEIELEEFKSLIEFYFHKRHPALKPGATINLYETLCNDVNDYATKNGLNVTFYPTFFRDIYKRYNIDRPKRNSLIQPAKTFLYAFKTKYSNNNTDPIIDSIVRTLWQLYKNDDIDNGLLLSENALNDHGPNVKLLKYFFRFEMRMGNFASIRNRIQSLFDYEREDDEFKTLFKAKLFECELRESYELIPNYNAFYNKVCNAQYLLEEIPNRLTNSEYHYLLGRFFMEKWWAFRNSDKTNLDRSLYQLNKSNKQDWWVECYKCIVLKLLNRKKEFYALATSHREMILQKHNSEPLMASLKIHCATAHIMLDDQPSLQTFLKKTEKPKSSTDFNSSLLHHIDIIYHSTKSKMKVYKHLIETWE